MKDFFSVAIKVFFFFYFLHNHCTIVFLNDALNIVNFLVLVNISITKYIFITIDSFAMDEKPSLHACILKF